MKSANKLNFGCGRDIRDGYVNLDHFPFAGVDVVHDFEIFPYPFADNQFDEIYCSHVLEHTGDLVRVMEEFNRIGKPGCLVQVLVPYFSSPYNALDPTHKRQFNLNTFDHFVNGNIARARIEILGRKVFFLTSASFMKSRWYSAPVDFLINLAAAVYQRLFCYILPASEVHFLLKIVK